MERGDRARLALAALAGCLAAGACAGSDVRTVEGTVNGVDAGGVGIVVDGEGFAVGNGTQWVGLDGGWRESGQPECLPPLSSGATVSLDVLDKAEGRAVVLEVRCLSLPTELLEPSPPELGLSDAYGAYCERLAGDEPPLRDAATNPCGRLTG